MARDQGRKNKGGNKTTRTRQAKNRQKKDKTRRNKKRQDKARTDQGKQNSEFCLRYPDLQYIGKVSQDTFDAVLP